MKLRCITNSIRLRLRRSELEQLRTRHKVEESVSFGSHALRYALMISPGGKVHASFNKGRVLVTIPSREAEAWMDSDQVGIETEQETENGHKLHILIEKDFPCKDRPDEDKSDTFEELAARQEEDKAC